MRIDGLGAFPLTPLADDELDERSLAAQISRLASSEVDSIAVLGSTGSGPYLTRAERARVIRIAVDEADGVPVFAGVGSPRTADVLAHIEDAERAGAAAVVVAAIAEQLRWATRSCLPRPLIGLDDEQRERLARVLDEGDLLPA